MSPFDVTIVFQKMSEIAPGQPAVVDQASISFSPQQFKALVRALQATITGYESAFGALTIPEEDIAPTKSAEEIGSAIKEARRSAKEHAQTNLSSTEPPPPSPQSLASSRKKGRKP